ncbi:MAG: hypothetical protein ACLQMO_11600 [Acidobacteriaceae bacterium]
MTAAKSVQSNTFERVEDLLDGRPGFRLTGEWGHVSMLEGGGHICEFVSNRHPGINPLWRPQWKTIEPYRYDPTRDCSTYGPLPDGRLLAGLAGHSLSFDHFGPPSAEEIAAGHSTHGEAPALKWTITALQTGSVPTAECRLLLPEARIEFSRKLSIDLDQPVVYCEESATNLMSFDRPISWNEHVTLGPPFLECGATMVDMPAVKGRVCGASYSSRMLLQPDTNFEWPMAPAKDGGKRDLRTTPEEACAQYTAQLLDPGVEFGYVAASNPGLQLLIVYLFRRADFPWVGNWEESFARSEAPWGERTFCRGMEFSTTPFAIPRRETVSQGTLFGEPTYRWLAARTTVSLRYMALLFEVPTDFQGVDQASIVADEVRIVERKTGRTFSSPARAFL